MPKPCPVIEQGIVAILRAGPVKQAEMGDYFPLDRYLDVSQTVRSMAARGVITREKCGATYLVRLSDNL